MFSLLRVELFIRVRCLGSVQNRVDYGLGVSGRFKIGSCVHIDFYIKFILKSGSVLRSGKYRVTGLC